MLLSSYNQNELLIIKKQINMDSDWTEAYYQDVINMTYQDLVNCTPKVRHKTFGVQFVYEVWF